MNEYSFLTGYKLMSDFFNISITINDPIVYDVRFYNINNKINDPINYYVRICNINKTINASLFMMSDF